MEENDFPKNESSWEELYEFGKERVKEIAALRMELERKTKLLKRFMRCSDSDYWSEGQNAPIDAEYDIEVPIGLLRDTDEELQK